MPFLVPAIGAVGSLLTTSFIGKLIVTTGLSFLLNALAKPKTDSSATGITGVRQRVQIGSDVPRQIPFGYGIEDGHFAYWNTYGVDNKFLQMVFILGDCWCESLQAVWVNGKRHQLTGITNEGNAVATYSINGLATVTKVRWFDGRPGQLADSTLNVNSNPAGRWTANDKLTGMCYVSLTLTYDKDIFETGIPDLSFEFQGARLYDWRKDSTNGGSGTHRWATTSTWEFSENPAVMRYNFQRGFFTLGQRVAGMGVPVTDLIHSLYTAAANLCDEVVTNPDATTRARYRASVIAYDDQPFSEVIKLLDESMAGYAVERQGNFGVIGGAAQTPIDTITDADLVTGESITWAAKRTRDELINAVWGQFLDPNHSWSMNSYTPQIDAAAITADGEQLVNDSADFPGVTDMWQAMTIASIMLKQNRLQATSQITLGFNKVWYEAGDWITWNSTRFGNKNYLITRRRIVGPNRRVQLDLQEVASSVYAGATLTAILPEQTAGDISTRVASVTSMVLTAATVTSGTGVNLNQLPTIDITYDPITDPTVTAVEVQYRKTGTTKVHKVTDTSPDDGFVTVKGLASKQSYEVRMVPIASPPRSMTFTAWTAVTTLGHKVGTDHLNDNAVDTVQINANAVNGTKIAANSITDVHVTAAADINGTKILSGSITGVKIAAGANIDGTKITSGTITNLQIHAAADINGAKILSNSIDGVKISGNVAGTKINAGTINDLQVGGLTGSTKITASSIANLNMGTNSIATINIVNGAATIFNSDYAGPQVHYGPGGPSTVYRTAAAFFITSTGHTHWISASCDLFWSTGSVGLYIVRDWDGGAGGTFYIGWAPGSQNFWYTPELHVTETPGTGSFRYDLVLILSGTWSTFVQQAYISCLGRIR